MALFSIHKPDQGYWTRVLSAAAVGTIVLSGVGWAWDKMDVIEQDTIYWQTGMAIAVILFFGGLLFMVLNRPRIVDFMIATEAEMKKVHWPNRKELIGSTLVVIWGTFIMALFLWLINMAFAALFLQAGVLRATGN